MVVPAPAGLAVTALLLALPAGTLAVTLTSTTDLANGAAITTDGGNFLPSGIVVIRYHPPPLGTVITIR
jgi:hypothetical protein